MSFIVNAINNIKQLTRNFFLLDGATCKIKADIALLVDGSSSVTKYGRKETKDPDYYKNYVMKALKELVQKFNVNKDEVHIAIVFFGSKDIQKIFNKVHTLFIKKSLIQESLAC